MGDVRDGPPNLPQQADDVQDDNESQPRSTTPMCTRGILVGGVTIALLFMVALGLCYYFHVFGWGLTEEEAIKNWNPQSLPPMQQSPPWVTWRNRTTGVRLPRILQWAGEPARVSRRSAEAFPSNRDSSPGRRINVTSCATPSLTGVRSGHCLVTARRDLLSESDAVVFHGGHFAITDLPNFRAVLQMWVFWAHNWPPKNESQLPRFLTLEAFPTLFNWTMSRREDSDVRIPSKVWRLKRDGGEERRRTEEGAKSGSLDCQRARAVAQPCGAADAECERLIRRLEIESSCTF
ncbi:hypothetical protein HPB48_006251 [Haemaphysalis longicornis]|uniref:Fucosyltransferase N-terminal domain-containing protein n=1 Tax=Haemaphysalis longicornis TaxID=44386 RepID=A0A9J6GRX5_HAELO|nr:hypothetical protein HPB48_006251 [Haemaphysalis longicornis]